MPALAPTRVVVFVVLVAAAMAGCSNPWAEHFQSAAAMTGPMNADAEMRIERVSFEEAMTVQEHAGMRLLGRSWFFDASAHGEERAAAFARTIGATAVLWGRTEPMRSTRTVTAHMPVTERTRTTGRVTGPDGRIRDVELTSTTTRWEDVASEVTETRYGHAAAFFGPPRATPDP